MAAPEWRKTAQRLERLSTPRGRRETGLFSLEGYRAMERALRNDAPITEVLVAEEFLNAPNSRKTQILGEVSRRELPLRVAPDGVVAELTGGRGLGNVFAILPLPPEPSWDELFPKTGRGLVVVGWNMGDPGNTGAVVRSALAAGASAFLAVGVTDPWHPKSVRTSMGSLFALPILHVEGEEWIGEFHRRGVETLATVCRDAETLPGFTPGAERLALVMGSEAFGLPDDLAGRLRRRVTIPMPEGVDSYSINAATAVLAYTLMQKPGVNLSTNHDGSGKVAP